MVIQVNGVNASRMYSVVIRSTFNDGVIYTESGVMGCDLKVVIRQLIASYSDSCGDVYADVIDSDGMFIDW